MTLDPLTFSDKERFLTGWACPVRPLALGASAKRGNGGDSKRHFKLPLAKLALVGQQEKQPGTADNPYRAASETVTTND